MTVRAEHRRSAMIRRAYDNRQPNYAAQLEQQVTNHLADREEFIQRIKELEAANETLAAKLERVQATCAQKLAAKDRDLAEERKRGDYYAGIYKAAIKRSFEFQEKWQKLSAMWNCVWDQRVREQAELDAAIYNPQLFPDHPEIRRRKFGD